MLKTLTKNGSDADHFIQSTRGENSRPRRRCESKRMGGISTQESAETASGDVRNRTPLTAVCFATSAIGFSSAYAK